MCDRVIKAILFISNEDYITLLRIQSRLGEVRIEQTINKIIAEYCDDERYAQDGGELRRE